MLGEVCQQGDWHYDVSGSHEQGHPGVALAKAMEVRGRVLQEFGSSHESCLPSSSKNERFVFEIYSNIVYYLNQVYYVFVDLSIAWYSLCLVGWWLLSPHQSFCLRRLSCLVEVAGGQVFQVAVVTMLLSCWMGLKAVSNVNPWRHVAHGEHVSRIVKGRRKRSTAAMEQNAMFQRIISLTEATTCAALSAEQTLTQI